MNPLNMRKTSTWFWTNQMRQYKQNIMGLTHHWEWFCLPTRTFKMLPLNSWVHYPNLLTRLHFLPKTRQNMPSLWQRCKFSFRNFWLSLFAIDNLAMFFRTHQILSWMRNQAKMYGHYLIFQHINLSTYVSHVKSFTRHKKVEMVRCYWIHLSGLLIKSV